MRIPRQVTHSSYFILLDKRYYPQRRAGTAFDLHRQSHDVKSFCRKHVEIRDVLECRDVVRHQRDVLFVLCRLAVVDTNRIQTDRVDLSILNQSLRRIRMQTWKV